MQPQVKPQRLLCSGSAERTMLSRAGQSRGAGDADGGQGSLFADALDQRMGKETKVVTKMEVKSFVLSEISQVEKDVVSGLSHVWIVKMLVTHKLRMGWCGL